MKLLFEPESIARLPERQPARRSRQYLRYWAKPACAGAAGLAFAAFGVERQYFAGYWMAASGHPAFPCSSLSL